MRIVRDDHGDSTVSGLLYRLGLLSVRLLGNEGDDTAGKICLAKLRFSNRDDVTTRRTDTQQDFRLRVQVVTTVKPRRLGNHKSGVVATLNVSDCLTQCRLLRPVAGRVPVKLKPLDDRDSALSGFVREDLDL